jgi:spermidine synthase
MGMAFPLICKIYTRSIKQLGGSVGAVYAVNTFGAVLGSLIGGFLMIPVFGIIKSIAALSVIGIMLGGLLLFAARARVARWFYGAAALASVACVVFTWTSDDILTSAYSIPEPGSQLAHYHEGRSGTITIHIYPNEERVISVNATNVAGTQFSLRTTQKLQAHIPMLVHGRARKVLQIGFGSGESCHVLSTYPVEQIDLVEIDADVLEASDEFFGDLNMGIVRHPKFNPIIMDGKNYALLSDEKYDVIMNDSTFPGKSGSASLYTRDHFLACRERLNEGGVMSSWVPFELWPIDFQNIVKTFQSVFPNTTLWLANNCRNKHALLLGTVGPFQVDFDRVAELMEMPSIKADLDEIRLGDPYVLMGSFNLDPTTAKRYSQNAPISSDENPILEFTAGRHFGTAASWRLNHSDFIKYRASIVPYLRFSKSGSKEADAVRQKLNRIEKANMHIDRARLIELTNEAEESYLGFRMVTLEQRREYEKALELYPEDENIPVFFEEGMATLYALEKLARNNPENAQYLFELGCAYRGLLRFPEAIDALSKASELDPANDQYRVMLRRALDESGEATE